MVVPARGDVAIAIDFHHLKNGNTPFKSESGAVIRIIGLKVFHAHDGWDHNDRRGGSGMGMGQETLYLAIQYLIVIGFPVTNPAPVPGGFKTETPIKILLMGAGPLRIDPPGEIKDEKIHSVAKGFIDVHKMSVVVPGYHRKRSYEGQVFLSGFSGFVHGFQGLINVPEVVTVSHFRPDTVVESIKMAVNRELKQEERGLDKAIGRLGYPGPIGGYGGRQSKGPGSFYQIQDPVIKHGFTAPEVDQGTMAMGHQIGQYIKITAGWHFTSLEFLQVKSPEKTVFSPLPACVAPEVAKISDAKTHLTNFSCPVTIAGKVWEAKEDFLHLQLCQLGGNPRLPGNPKKVPQDHI